MEQDPEDISTLDTVFKSVVDESHPRRVGDFDAFEYDDDSDKREAREVAKLREKLQSLKVVARAKVNQNRIYSAAYHPEVSKDLIFFGGKLVIIVKLYFHSCLLPDKHGELGIWDARAAPDEVLDDDEDTEVGTREGGKYWRLQCHWPASSKSSTTSIKFDPVNAHTVGCYFVSSVCILILHPGIYYFL